MGLSRPPALVVPGDLPGPSGGTVWDRRVHDALAGSPPPEGPGWHPVPGRWPTPSSADLLALDAVLTGLPDRAPVLLDGLVGCAAPDVLAAHTGRLRLGVVLHLPLGLQTGLDAAEARTRDAAERRSLALAEVVVVTSRWTASWLSGHTLRRPPVVAVPGTDRTDLLPVATGGGRHLLCLGAVCRRKDQRGVVEALGRLGEGDPGGGPAWSLHVVGPHPEPDELEALQRRLDATGLGDRVEVTGPLVGEALAGQWRWADLLVLPSHTETFGMVVGESLARGRPALVATGSALPEALGTTPAGPPGLLVPPGDPGALAGALDRWLTDEGLRGRLRERARERAGTLSGWDGTARAVAGAFR